MATVKKKAPAAKKTAVSGEWRKPLLDQARKVILGADPDMVETVKWRKPSNPAGVAAWECAGLICTGEMYKDKVKLTFAYGASLKDPSGLFNASLDAGTRRAIDFPEGAKVNEKALGALVREAVKFNRAKAKG